jgi:hypothetical protein
VGIAWFIHTMNLGSRVYIRPDRWWLMLCIGDPIIQGLEHPTSYLMRTWIAATLGAKTKLTSSVHAPTNWGWPVLIVSARGESDDRASATLTGSGSRYFIAALGLGLGRRATAERHTHC